MKLPLYSVILLCFFAQNGAAWNFDLFNISHIFDSLAAVISGVGQEVINRIPTPEYLFNVSALALAGLPEIAVYQTIDKLCSIYMAAETIEPHVTPDIESMSFKLHTPCEVLSFPLNHAEKILESPEFDANKTVVIFVAGWMASSEAVYVADMANAYNCRGNHNFLAFNSSASIDTLYTWSAYNTKAVGQALAVGLQKLLQKVPAENIHLIGHSLGAHIVGYAGRYFSEETGFELTRITGLDPANPCFGEGSNLSGLQRGDALFIDVIHTNRRAMGVSDSIGDVDFYPGGRVAIQPGCAMFDCSHKRALEYFIESVYPGNENNFLSVRCTSLLAVKRGNCRGKTYPMGYAAPHNLTGNYYLSVNDAKPFGQNNQNREAVPSDCRKCRKQKKTRHDELNVST